MLLGISNGVVFLLRRSKTPFVRLGGNRLSLGGCNVRKILPLVNSGITSYMRPKESVLFSLKSRMKLLWLPCTRFISDGGQSHENRV